MKILIYIIVVLGSVCGSIWAIVRHKNFQPIQANLLVEKVAKEEPIEEKEIVKKTGLFSEKRLTPLLENPIFSPTRVIATTVDGKTTNTMNMELIGILKYANMQVALIALPVTKSSNTSSSTIPKELEEQIEQMPPPMQERIREAWANNPEMRENLKNQILANVQGENNSMMRGGMMRGGNRRENVSVASNTSAKDTQIATKMFELGATLDNGFELLEIAEQSVTLQKGTQLITLEIDGTDKNSQTRNEIEIKERLSTNKIKQVANNKQSPQNMSRFNRSGENNSLNAPPPSFNSVSPQQTRGENTSSNSFQRSSSRGRGSSRGSSSGR